MPSLRLSLGPILYYWQHDKVLQFYEEVENLPLDIIYIGETVCSKRRALRTAEWIELGRKLARSGKQVVLSTLTLVEAESELGTIVKLCNNGELLVEANDMAAVNILAERGLPFVAGTAINIYNARTLRYLHRRGLTRWVAPMEMSQWGLTAILEEAEVRGFRDDFEMELFCFGHMPLAYSARCFTARAQDLAKDDCGFVCLEHPDGLPVLTQDGERFLTLNGIQTQSGQVLNLLPEWRSLLSAGVQVMRISPQSEHISAIVNEIHAALAADRVPSVEQFTPAGTCDGYWHGNAGMRQRACAGG